MSQTVSRWVIPDGTDLTTDADVFPHTSGEGFFGAKAPLWSTDMKTATSGREFRRRVWSYPKWAFETSYGHVLNQMTNSDLVRILSFYNSKAGQFREFFFLDPEDCAVASMQFGVGDGVTTVWQPTRTAAVGGISFTEPVRGFSGAPTVTVGGVMTAVTVTPYGAFQFAAAPGAGQALAWTGTFFFLCRFLEDTISASGDMQRIWNMANIKMQTVKP